MQEKGWERGRDDEELLEYALHPTQYEDFKSGKAKENFLADLEKRKAAKAAPATSQQAQTVAAPHHAPRTMLIDVDGVKYRVKVAYEDQENAGEEALQQPSQASTPVESVDPSTFEDITSPLEGKLFLTKDPGQQPIRVGDMIKEGDTVAYIESMKVINAVTADKTGKVMEVVGQHGSDIEEDDVIFRIS